MLRYESYIEQTGLYQQKGEQMRITQVNIRLLDTPGEPLAIASVVLDSAYAVIGIRIIRRADGELQILYPNLPTKIRIKGKRHVLAFKPITAQAHRRIEKAVLDAYREHIRQSKIGNTSDFRESRG